MSRPFDEARYRALLEGLEAVEIQSSLVLTGTATKRIDPEYFNRAALLAQQRLDGASRLGDLVRDGYRVVYENTQAIDREEGIKAGLPFFLQSSDISTPFIDADAMVCVTDNDWLRYPKGRIKAGELLIEVKGKAEKIAIVPDDFPEKTLVTGTCFKLTTKEPDDRYILTAYLTCKYGQALKDRLKTNLLVSYLAKDDLYSLPVPRVSIAFREAIKCIFQRCFSAKTQSKEIQHKVEQTLSHALGLEEWQPPEPLTYTLPYRDAFAAGRLDAEFHHPRYEAIFTELTSRFDIKTLDQIGMVSKGVTVPYYEEGTVPIIRSGDLSNIDDDDRLLRTNPNEPFFQLEKGDVLISSIGFGSIGKVQVFDKEGHYGTVSEVTVLRQKLTNPYYLAAFFRSKAGQMQIERFITGATGQLHLYPRDVAKFWVPVLHADKQMEFELLAKAALAKKTHATKLLDAAKRAVEIAIEESEDAALDYLKEYL